GRGVLIRGRHARADEAGTRPPPIRRALGVPIVAPEWLLNPVLVRLFNGLYYRVQGAGTRARQQSYERFFYPLDAIRDWNRLYGPRGFLQYQCVLPRAAGRAAVGVVLDRLAAAGA